MEFKLKINTDNDAFQSASTHEIARILRKLADKVEDSDMEGGYLHDINGNRIGEWDVWKS